MMRDKAPILNNNVATAGDGLVRIYRNPMTTPGITFSRSLRWTLKKVENFDSMIEKKNDVSFEINFIVNVFTGEHVPLDRR